NHDPAMLETGPYPFPLKQRIRGDHGHLSNAAAGETVCELVDSGVPHIVLAHLSQENNYPVLAYQATELALTACGKVPGKDLTLEVAGRSQRSEIYEW
ncbi:MAG: MBL fold metallo-hydrolase, partial [Eubacterium sp.]